MSVAKLVGKVAVVTASTDGIGFAIAKRLGLDGAKLIISSRKEAHVNEAVKRLKDDGIAASGTVCHVGKADDRTKLLRRAVDEFGGIDILVNNAGTNPTFGPILDTTEEAWDKIFDVNLKSAFLLTKEAVPYLQKRKSSSIIFVSSITAYVPSEVIGPYSVSKAALVALTKALSNQCGRMGIRVNAIAPGIIKTKFAQALVESDHIREAVLQQTSLGRLGEPEDCGGIVSFLASDDARYITGETVVVAGGMPSRL